MIKSNKEVEILMNLNEKYVKEENKQYKLHD